MRNHLFIYLLWTAVLVLVAKTIGSAGLGGFVLVISIASIICVLSLVGVTFGNVLIIRNLSDNKFAITGNNFLIAFVWGGLISVGAHSLLTDRLNQYLSDIGTNQWNMAMIAIIPLMLFELSDSVLKNFTTRFLSFIILLLKSLGIILAVLFFIGREELSAETAIGSWVLVLSVTSFIYLILTWGIVGHEITLNFSLIWKSICSGFRSYVVGTFSMLSMHLDLILIAYFLTIQDVGKYAVAVALAGIIHRSAWVLSRVLLSIRKISNKPNLPSPLTIRLAFNFALLVGVLILFGSWYLIRFVIGYEFLTSYVVLLLLIPGCIFLSQSGLVLKYYVNKNDFFHVVSNAIATFVLFFGLNLVLIPAQGINGAALAFSLSQGFSWVILLYIYAREHKTRLSGLFIINSGDLIAGR